MTAKKNSSKLGSVEPPTAPEESGEGAGDAKSANKKQKQTINYPPYVNSYGSIAKLFAQIKKASVPPKFTQDFMESILDLRSSSHRALIPLLKKLQFIDAANVPTEAYKQYRDDSIGKSVMAQQVRSAYGDIYKANEYAHSLKKDELTSKIRSLTGAAENDLQLPAVVGTFQELVKLADFDQKQKFAAVEPEVADDHGEVEKRRPRAPTVPFGLSYTINLHLPATTEIEVFNAIFRSMKEHMLDG